MSSASAAGAGPTVLDSRQHRPRPEARVSNQHSLLKEGSDQECQQDPSKSRQAETTSRRTLAGQAGESAIITEIHSQTGKPAVESPK